MNRRQALLSLSAVALASLAACSGIYSIGAEVRSFGRWPQDRAPGSYAIERLPSQQGENGRLSSIEAQARAALEKAGFKPASDARSADILVSLGVRISAQDRAPWDDPLWWRWHTSIQLWRYGRLHPSPFMLDAERRYEREVALLLRDRASGEPLYEARASNDGATQGDEVLVGALFEAALSDFPKVQPEPHRVVVQRSY